MFIGRNQELSILEELYESDRFEFLILYGRRRVGKTELLGEFTARHRKDVVYFSALQKNDALNLEDFSKLVQGYYSGSYIAPFPNWEEAFKYYGDHAGNEKRVLIIDEFPYLAEPTPTIMSILQHLIDKDWKKKKIVLILCGSNVSFMEKEVISKSAPLYGRTTHQFELKTFNYLDAAKFFPNYSVEDKLIAYGILGGVPRYLAEFDSKESLAVNISRRIVRNGAFLKDEPQTFLKMETREAATYNSILTAISEGINKTTRIGDRIHEEKTKVGKYLVTLQNLRLINKEVPCGSAENTRNSIYKIKDNYFNFWYRFEFSNHNYYDLLGPEKAATEILDHISNYMGIAFEDICREYLVMMAKLGKLPFVPYHLSKWWGTNPALKAQDDVDILGLSRDGSEGIFCECKFKSKPFEMADYDDVIDSIKAFPDVKKYYMYFFSKSGYTEPVKRRAEEEHAVLLGLDDLFNI